MPNFYIGSTPATKAYFGTTLASKIYLGSDLIWPLSSGISDDFNRANGNLTTPWVRYVSYAFDNYAITGNQLYRTGSGGTDGSDGNDAYIYNSATSTSDQYAEIDLPTLTSSVMAGVVLGHTNTAGTNAILAQINTTGWRIIIGIPGNTSGRTIVASGSGTFTQGAKFRAERIGNIVRVSYDGHMLGTYSSASLPSGTFIGVCAGNGSNRLDNFAGGSISSFTIAYAFTPTHTDNFNRANGDLSSVAPWEDAGVTSASRVQVVSNSIQGQGAVNTRCYYATTPNGTVLGTYYKVDIVSISGSGKCGVAFAAQSNSGRPMAFAVLTNSTTLVIGENTSTSSSNTGTVLQTITVPTFTSGTLLAVRKSATTVEIYLNGNFIGVYTFSVGSSTGYGGGVLTVNSTDIIDNYEQGTWS